MSEKRKQSLFILAYPGRDTADVVWKTLRELERAKRIDVKASMLIYRKESGKLKLVHKRHVGTWGGAAAGGAIGLLLAGATGGGAVLAGALVGAAIGGIAAGQSRDVKELLEDKLGTDDSALAILIEDAEWDVVAGAIGEFGGEELAVELTDEAAAQLAALGAKEDVAAAISEEVEIEEANGEPDPIDPW
jgi:uncharacterized membrane protein